MSTMDYKLVYFGGRRRGRGHISRSRFRCKIEDSRSNIVFKNFRLKSDLAKKINGDGMCSSVQETPDSVVVVLFPRGRCLRRGLSKLSLFMTKIALKTIFYI